MRRVGIKQFRSYSRNPSDGFQLDSYAKTQQGTRETWNRVSPEGPDPNPTLVLIAEHHPETDRVRLNGDGVARFDAQRVSRILTGFLEDEERARSLLRENGVVLGGEDGEDGDAPDRNQ